MKLRHGFVSNSSSSSFTCEITGETFEIYDGLFKDSELAQCVRGHIVRRDLLLPWTPKYPTEGEMRDQLEAVNDSKSESKRIAEMTGDALKKRWKARFACDENEYETRAEQCPICTMSNLPDTMMLDYMLQTNNTNRQDLIKKLKTAFGNYDTLANWLSK